MTAGYTKYIVRQLLNGSLKHAPATMFDVILALAAMCEGRLTDIKRTIDLELAHKKGTSYVIPGIVVHYQTSKAGAFTTFIMSKVPLPPPPK